MEDDSCVMIFVRAPESGAVKSRLAASIGGEAARDLYRCFVEDSMQMLARSGYPVIVFFHPPESAENVARWLGENRRFFPQQGEDLGVRMKGAFETVFSQGMRCAVLIGSDSPDLPGQIIGEALASLGDSDAVLGPSYDGGYYLIGFRKDTFLPAAFEGIPWSTQEVFARTADVLRKGGLRVHRLPTWRDIDTADDLRALYLESRGAPFSESATIRYIEENIYGS